MPEDNTSMTPSMPPVDPSATSGAPVASSTSAGASSDNSSNAPFTASVTPEPMATPAPTTTQDPVSSVVVDPLSTPATTVVTPESESVYTEVANRIRNAKNILIALSGDPSVDEMSAAIGLSLYLDKLGKRATAIYSGATPNALEFLKPEETFESTADTLQDFVIALNKDKADHLRYKLDGEYVKIYITPYKTRISEEDLDFSYGDFNVDLVLALDVANGIDLDSALREHGRIMHDAVIINVTTGNPGKFGEIEWSDKHASSVSEMIAKLLYSVTDGSKVEKEEATAFLTGIVAATNRFSNASTTPETMQIAAKLMKSGANQQLVSKNITPDIENEIFSMAGGNNTTKSAGDPTKLDIGHPGDEDIDESKEIDATVTEKDSTLLDDLKAAEASLAQAGAETTPEENQAAVKIDSTDNSSNIDEVASPEESDKSTTEPASNSTSTSSPESTPIEPESTPPTELPTEPTSESSPDSASATAYLAPEPTAPEEPTITEPSPEASAINAPEKVLQPSEDFGNAQPLTLEDENKYSQMLENALDDVNNNTTNSESNLSNSDNPAAMNAPTVPTNPEINGVPEMNYMPMPGEEILPPPPAPPIDTSGLTMPTEPTVPTPVEQVAPTMPSVAPIEPATPATEPTPEPLGNQPAMQDQVYNPQAADPGAFKIPGM